VLRGGPASRTGMFALETSVFALETALFALEKETRAWLHYLATVRGDAVEKRVVAEGGNLVLEHVHRAATRPLHDVVITNTVWCMAYKWEVGGGGGRILPSSRAK